MSEASTAISASSSPSSSLAAEEEKVYFATLPREVVAAIQSLRSSAGVYQETQYVSDNKYAEKNMEAPPEYEHWTGTSVSLILCATEILRRHDPVANFKTINYGERILVGFRNYLTERRLRLVGRPGSSGQLAMDQLKQFNPTTFHCEAESQSKFLIDDNFGKCIIL